MIQIVYHKKLHRVTVKGHANSAAEGHDLVCAAVSAITHTLAANIRRLNELGNLRSIHIYLQKGNAEISCKCKHESKMGATVTLMFDALCLGYGELAKDYPEFVCFEIRG